MATRVPRQETTQGIAGRRQERLRHSPGWRHAHGIPIPRRVLRRDPAWLPGHTDLHRAAVGGESPQPLPGGAATRQRIHPTHPVGHLVGRQVTQTPQQVVDLVRRSCGTFQRQRL